MTGRPIVRMRRGARVAWALLLAAAAFAGFIFPVGPIDLRPDAALAVRVAWALGVPAAVGGGLAIDRWLAARSVRVPPSRLTLVLSLVMAGAWAFLAMQPFSIAYRRPILAITLLHLVIAAGGFLEGRTYTALSSPEES